MLKRAFLWWLSAVCAVLLVAGPAQAFYPGTNGKIAFQRYQFGGGGAEPGYDIRTVSPVGTDDTRITHFGDAQHPAWSPDGTRIAFAHAGGIYTVAEDGSDLQHVIDWSLGIDRMAWSPDGTRLAASLGTCDGDECRLDLYTLGLDGTNVVDLTPDPFQERNPTWSPDGSQIAFDSPRDGTPQVFKMQSDGAGVQQLTFDPARPASWPSWSPDGNKIAFMMPAGASCGSGSPRIHSMNPDGTGVKLLNAADECAGLTPAYSPDSTQLVLMGGFSMRRINAAGGTSATLLPTPNATSDAEPVWALATTPTVVHGTYARPKGATPLVTYLVPAYQPCTSANESHGSPLASPSCSPPIQSSSRITVGTADSNGLPTRGSTAVDVTVIPGNAATSADEADVAVRLHATDVYRASDLADYTGGVLLELRARVTDRDNTPAQGDDAGGTAVSPKRFDLPVSCVATADTTTGGQCDLETTLDAVTPGIVSEGARAVWELDQVQLFDGGPDDDPATLTFQNNVFEVQGVFVP